MLNNSKFFVPNSNSRESKIDGLIYEVDKKLLNKLNNNLPDEKYICICSGGTTSACARDNFKTIDLRQKYNQICFNKDSCSVTIGGGVLMGELLHYLRNFNRVFPTGLSPLPGVGYILTGGISPLSRRYGLAIDNIKSLKGYLGNGQYFDFQKNKLNSEEEKIWFGIQGAAPFISIITEIELETFPSYPIMIFEGFISDKELGELIYVAEKFPDNFSLQWICAKRIYIYIVAEIKTPKDEELAKIYTKNFQNYPTLKKQIYKNYGYINFFPKELDIFELNQSFYSEVISLLGENLENKNDDFVKELLNIKNNRPNNSCYIASQQLGGQTKKGNNSCLFAHRKSTWKPWIYCSWDKNDLHEKEVVLAWMNESWNKLRKFYPHIHLAQLHNHLSSHKEEIELAFGNKLGELKSLKNFCDPKGILPPL